MYTCFMAVKACRWSIDAGTGNLVSTGFAPFAPDRMEISKEEKTRLRRARDKCTQEERALEERAVTKASLRYQYYVEQGVSDEVLAPIKEEWIRNSLSLLRFGQRETERHRLGAATAQKVGQVLLSNLF